jgi:CheY-like chemotaxis protein
MRSKKGHETDMPDILTNDQFLKHLRDALNHLYDPDRLRQSPLATLFGVGDRFDTPARLQCILTEAIESLESEADEAPRSRSRRIYDLLLYRYVQQFSQQEVANQLGLSVRHLRREQHAALEVLACRLWEQFHLETKLRGDADVAVVQGASGDSTGGPSVNDELAWLRDAPPERSDLDQTLTAVQDLVQPLAVQHEVHLEITLADTLPNLAVHPVALRQILLNLLSLAIRQTDDQVCILVRSLRWEVEIHVQCAKSSSGSPPVWGGEDSSLDMARRLVRLCGGMLTTSDDKSTFEVTLVLPALEQLPVLGIDDNADTLQLLRRYTANTRYRFIGVQDPEQALGLAEQFSPQIIVLDVMMPQIDGWEVLGRLRQHPLTSRLPIIVCTILAQEELALSLGASALVCKPITRQDFLSALDQQVAQMETKSR